MENIKQIVCIVLSMCFMLCGNVSFAQDAPEVNVYLDAHRIATGLLFDSRTLVPIRVLSESMGYSVGWDGDTQTVTVSNGAVTNVLTVGSEIASRITDDEQTELTLDVAPIIVGSRTYVPLRYISESLGCCVIWYGSTHSVYIASPMQFTVYGASFTQANTNEETVVERLGGPYDTIDGADAIRRLVYMHSENGSMTVFGFYENQLFEFFTNDTAAQINGVQISQMQPESHKQTTKVFYDEIGANKPVAYYMNVAGYGYCAYTADADKSAVMLQEAKLTFYLTNSLRRLAGKQALVYSNELAEVNKAHVASMAENDFFAHEGLAGDGITDRIKAAPRYMKYTLLGENLAKMPNVYYAGYGWLNSLKHRENMLHGAYSYIGISVDGNLNENLYYAQVFVKL